MKRINIYILGLILFVGLAACSEDKEQVVGKGILRVGVQVDRSVLTKADDTAVKLLIVKVDADGNPLEGAPTTEYTVSAGVEKEIALEATTYSITAISGNDPKGKPTSEPYYSGSQLISLTAGETKPVKIECKLTTAVIAVDYSGLSSYVSNGYDFQTVVQLQGSADKIVFGKDETDKNGYFLPTGTLSVTFRYGKNNVWQEIAMQSVTDIEAQHKYVIKYSEKEDSGDVQQGAAGIGIVVVQPSETGENVQIGVTLPKLTSVIEPLSDNLLGDVYANVYATASMNNGATVNQLSFVYQESNASTSQEITAASNNNKWHAKLEGLKPATQYKVWVKDHADIYQEFTTKSVTKPANAWAKFAYLSAAYSKGTPSSQVKFQYRKASEMDWVDAGVSIDQNDKQYEAMLTGLEPNTEYQYRFMSEGLDGNIVTFTTEGVVTLPNMGFEDWVLKPASSGLLGSSACWYPNTKESATDTYWACGNEGVTSALAGKKASITVRVEGSEAKTGYAAKLTTISGVTLVGVAAGNLFTGTYKTDASKPANSVNFGQTYTGARPTKLSGYYKYISKAISSRGEPADLQKDLCDIYIWLKDSNDNMIAFGRLSNDNEMSEYEHFDIPIQYLETYKSSKPAKIAIVATSSRYGGNFTGSKVTGSVGAGSTLYVDEFELSYDDAPVFVNKLEAD